VKKKTADMVTGLIQDAPPLDFLWCAIAVQLEDPKAAKLLAGFAWDAAMRLGWATQVNKLIHVR
jgi:hypothetical protein